MTDSCSSLDGMRLADSSSSVGSLQSVAKQTQPASRAVASTTSTGTIASALGESGADLESLFASSRASRYPEDEDDDAHFGSEASCLSETASASTVEWSRVSLAMDNTGGRGAASTSGAQHGFYATEVHQQQQQRSAQLSTGSRSSASFTTDASERFTSCSDASSYYTDGSMVVGGGRRSHGSVASHLRRSDLELVRAAERGDTNSVKSLLSSSQVSSVDIGVGATYRTPLHRAAGYGQEDVVQMLLEARAMVGSRDINNRTPLHEACTGGYSRCLKMLLSADGTAHIDVADKTGQTAAHMAAMHGESACLEMMLNYGCDPCAEDRNGETAAHHAVRQDHSHALKVLVDRGIEVDCPDQEGRAPAHFAAQAGALGCLRMLATSGVDMCCADDRGQQPCHIAAERNRLKCLKFLLKSGGAEVESRDSSGRTLLHVAAQSGSLDCLHWLLETGISTSCLDAEGRTPLHSAAGAGEPESFHCLQQHGANLDLKDAHNRLAVHVARENGHALEIMQAIEGKRMCHYCHDASMLFRSQQLHKRAPVEDAMASLGQSVFSTALSFSGNDVAMPTRISKVRNASGSKSLSRLPPLERRRSSPSLRKPTQSRAKDAAELSRDIVTAMVYGQGAGAENDFGLRKL